MTERDYSSTPLPKKLGVREGSRVLIVAAPKGFGRTLGELPQGAEIKHRARAPIDVVILFVTELRELRKRFDKLAEVLDPAGRLWIAWPKKAAKADTDLTFEIVQKVGLEAGLVDNKSAAIDATFQGLQFVHRVRDRPGR